MSWAEVKDNKVVKIHYGNESLTHNGIQHPANIFTHWSKAELKNIEIYPYTQTRENKTSKCYLDGEITYQVKNDEVVGTITAIPFYVGKLKDKYNNFCNEKAFSLLSQTDWEVIKAVELGTTISDKLKTYRASVRSKCNELQNSINACTSIDDFKKILDPVGDSSEALIDNWPLLELE